MSFSLQAFEKILPTEEIEISGIGIKINLVLKAVLVVDILRQEFNSVMIYA
jgi:hypothetical protein